MLRGVEKGNGTRLYRALVVRVTTLTLTLSERGAVGGNTVTCSDLGCIPMAAEGRNWEEDKSRRGAGGEGTHWEVLCSPSEQSWGLD